MAREVLLTVRVTLGERSYRHEAVSHKASWEKALLTEKITSEEPLRRDLLGLLRKCKAVCVAGMK